MPKFFKVLLIWLCALAFPLQGMAAVVMLSCGASHHQAAAQTHASHAEHHHDLTTPEEKGHSTHKCSACASCCIGIGMAATLPQWQGESQGPSALVTSVVMLLPSFMAEGLERPPRFFLA